MPDEMVGEKRMLIDGELVLARSGKEFHNINPATEEVLGQAADAGHEVAIAAARRAFDETRWPPTSRSGSAAWNSSRRAWPTSASRSAPITLT